MCIIRILHCGGYQEFEAVLLPFLRTRGYPTVRHVDAKVDGRTAVATGGICDRTREVHAKLVALTAGVSSCADMDAAALAAIPATLDLDGLRIAALKPGDFAGLGHVTSLLLTNNALTDIAPGVLDPLTGLTALALFDNAIARVPAGAFDMLPELAILQLDNNEIGALLPGTFDRQGKLAILTLGDNHLAALPDGIFEPLTSLSSLSLTPNPGSADFVPSAVAVLPNGETGIWEGRTIELDASASTGGPWGSNLVYAWAVTGPVEGGFADPEAARTTVTYTKTRAGVPIPRPLHPPDRDLRQPHHGLRWRDRLLPAPKAEGARAEQAPLRHHDRQRRRVHPPLLAPCPARRDAPHPSLRHPRQRMPCQDAGERARSPRLYRLPRRRVCR